MDSESEDELWAQVMPREGVHEEGLQERVAKGGHGVPLSGK